MRYDVQQANLQSQQTAVVRGHAAPADVGEFLARAFGDVMTAAHQQGLEIQGAPFGRYQLDNGELDVEAGFPVSGAISPTGDVEASELPAGVCAKTMHVGAYAEVRAAYEALYEWITDSGQVPSADPWECYLDPPDVAAPRTTVFWPYQSA